VGTNEEVIMAMYMYYNKLKKSNSELPFILNIFEKEISPKMNQSDFVDLEKKLFTLYVEEDIIPQNIKFKLLDKYSGN
jgi:hypothetical protein